MVLLAIGEAAADNGDVVTFMKFQESLGLQEGRESQRSSENEEACDHRESVRIQTGGPHNAVIQGNHLVFYPLCSVPGQPVPFFQIRDLYC